MLHKAETTVAICHKVFGPFAEVFQFFEVVPVEFAQSRISVCASRVIDLVVVHDEFVWRGGAVVQILGLDDACVHETHVIRLVDQLLVFHHDLSGEIDVVPQLVHVQSEIGVHHRVRLSSVDAFHEAVPVLLDHRARVVDVFVTLAEEYHFLLDSSRVLELHDIALVASAGYTVVSQHLGKGVAQVVQGIGVSREHVVSLGVSQNCRVCDDALEEVVFVVVLELGQIALVCLVHVLH